MSRVMTSCEGYKISLCCLINCSCLQTITCYHETITIHLSVKYKLNIHISAFKLTLNVFHPQPNHPYTYSILSIYGALSEFIVQTSSIY